MGMCACECLHACLPSPQEAESAAALSAIDGNIEARVRMHVDIARHRVLDERELAGALRAMSHFRHTHTELEVWGDVCV